MGMMINRRRTYGGRRSIITNIKTYSTSSHDAVLSVKTGDEKRVLVHHNDAKNKPFINQGVIVKYNQTSFSWVIVAAATSIYNGHKYNIGETIANWNYTKIEDITIKSIL